MRKIIFTNNNYYHIYNRGVDKRRVFLRNGHFKRFIETISNLLEMGTAQSNLFTRQDSAFNNRLKFISYCLMPNHYHFILKQTEDGAISDFMHALNTSYTKYFNLNNNRTGRLFEYTFKAVYVETEEQLLHLSRYIHLNPFSAGIVSDLEEYYWSSYKAFIGVKNEKLCDKGEVLDLFKADPYKEYRQFVMDEIDYKQQIEKFYDLLLD